MSKSYFDSKSGMWKWGTNGKPIYKTEDDCNKAGVQIIFDRLMYIKSQLKKSAK